MKDLAGNALASTVTSTFTTAAVSATYSLFSNSGHARDRSIAAMLNPSKLGVKFQSTINGYITGIRFYRATGNDGNHTVHLWSSTGQLLATATAFTVSGWQQIDFATPVAITAGVTYTASYHTVTGRYSMTRNFFASARDQRPAHRSGRRRRLPLRLRRLPHAKLPRDQLLGRPGVQHGLSCGSLHHRPIGKNQPRGEQRCSCHGRTQVKRVGVADDEMHRDRARKGDRSDQGQQLPQAATRRGTPESWLRAPPHSSTGRRRSRRGRVQSAAPTAG